ncbi:hypothetical protein D3C80_1892120 [compost metagenome]
MAVLFAVTLSILEKTQAERYRVIMRTTGFLAILAYRVMANINVWKLLSHTFPEQLKITLIKRAILRQMFIIVSHRQKRINIVKLRFLHDTN